MVGPGSEVTMAVEIINPIQRSKFITFSFYMLEKFIMANSHETIVEAIIVLAESMIIKSLLAELKVLFAFTLSRA